MSKVLNPTLQGVDDVQEVGGRLQAIPPAWALVNGITSAENPAPEVFNQEPSGSKVEIGWRTVFFGYTQLIENVVPGRYVLKARVVRNTKGPINDLGWGFYLAWGESAFTHRSGGPFTRHSGTGEVLEVIDIIGRPATITIGLFIDSTFASNEGHLVVEWIDMVRVADDYGSDEPAVTIDTSVSPEPGPEPTPGNPVIASSPNGMHRVTVWVDDDGAVHVKGLPAVEPVTNASLVKQLLEQAIALVTP